MSRVAVNESVLRWAIERSGLSRGALQEKFPKLQQWIAGAKWPTLHQLEAFAKATSTPFGYLFLSEPPEDTLPIPHFRTIEDEPANRPSPDLLETVHFMERRQGWMREFLIDQGQEPLANVRSARLGDSPRALAQKMRSNLGLAEGWAAEHRTWTEALGRLRSAMEESGILVVVNSIVGNNTHRKLNPTEFRGFVLVDEYAPLVFVNGADWRAAQMFTLAHELAHIWFGSSASFDLRQLLPARDRTEQACNAVAAEFLVPEVKLREAWPLLSSEPDPLQAIARNFKVSVLVAARRALDLGLISRAQFFEFYDAYQARERRTAEQQAGGGDFYASQNLRISRRFADAVIRAVQEGRLLYHEAYQLTGISGKTFDRYAASLGFEERRG